MFDINVEKKKTSANNVSIFRKVNHIENRTIFVISTSFINNTPRKSNHWIKIMSEIVAENPRNFHIINSYLLMGFDNIRKMVFPSISLKSNWLPTNKTHSNEKISIIASQKSVTTFVSSPIVSFPNSIENAINANANTRMRYRNLFLIISLKVFNAMLNM